MLPELNEERQRLLVWLERLLAAIDPRECTRKALADSRLETAAVLAIGKAARGMALGAADVLGAGLERAMVIAPDVSGLPAEWRAVRGNHPVPGAESLAAGTALREWIAALPDDEPLVALISGGGSALVEIPVAGVSGDALARLNRWLLASGLDVSRMNAIRARFSQLKRGGLLRLAGERPVIGLVMSDVPGDRIEDVASGPLSPMSVAWPRIGTPRWLDELHAAAALPVDVPGQAELRLIANNATAIRAVCEAAAADGVRVIEQGALHGDASECAREIVSRMKRGPSGIHVFGGESTVQLPPSPGRGGRNQHLALTAAVHMRGDAGLLLLAFATDGIDGNSADAGALVDDGTVARIEAAGLDAWQHLAEANSGAALEAAGDIIHTGATGANVADIVIGWKR